ncbi:unnamed protein product [Amoebophrya sp. A120]|nr:unnamed protein product [Amoebophrya sp. A120]|eukprot:GSA120T00015173001.1
MITRVRNSSNCLEYLWGGSRGRGQRASSHASCFGKPSADHSFFSHHVILPIGFAPAATSRATHSLRKSYADAWCCCSCCSRCRSTSRRFTRFITSSEVDRHRSSIAAGARCVWASGFCDEQRAPTKINTLMSTSSGSRRKSGSAPSSPSAPASKRAKLDTSKNANARTAGKNKKYLLTIDQGTTSTRCLLFDYQFRHVRTAQEEFPQYYPKPGWVEHEPSEILQSVRNCATKLKVGADEVAAIGIANQRETTVAWDRSTGKPLHKAIVWMDTRTHDVVKDLLQKYDQNTDHFRAKTGLPISTYFAGIKIRWLLQNVPAVKAAHDSGRCCFGTIDSWLVYNMTGKFVTDISNASRYLAMDLKKRKWDAAILKELGISSDSLPEIVSNVADFGKVKEEFCAPLAGVPVTGVLGDQHAALVGQNCFSPGEAKNTYGTGCFMIANTGPTIVPSTKGLLTTIGYQMGVESPTIYALEGSVAIAGRLIQWLRDNLKIIRDAPDIEAVAKQCDSTNGVVIVPAFQGLFAPYWRDDARAVISGMTLQAGRPELCRAALEAVALQVCDVFTAMEGDGISVKQLRVDGGMTVNETLMQTQANFLGVKVQRPAMVETTALGAVIAAAIGVGLYRNTDEVRSVCNASFTTFSPSVSWQERKTARDLWAKAVAKTVGDHSNL